MSKDLNYTEDLMIDQDQLDYEWLTQSSNYMKYQEQAIFAQTKVDKANERLGIYEAELDATIRAEAKESKEKITEAQIKNQIIVNEERLELVQEVRVAKEHYNILSAAVKSFDHKKKALEYLSQLWMGGYYSEPKAPNVKDKILDNVSDRIRNGLKK
jgi:hypothetical protein